MVHDAVTAQSPGMSLPVLIRLRSSIHPTRSILRAFLVEEAKIVKKVIKSQEKAGRK